MWNRKDIRMETSAAVDAGVTVFADLEALAEEAEKVGAGLMPVFEALRDNGVISGFECKALKLEAKAIVLAFKAGVWTFHAKTTQRAQFKGIDIITTDDSGGHR